MSEQQRRAFLTACFLGDTCQNLQLDPFRVLGCRMRSREGGCLTAQRNHLAPLVGQGPVSKYETNDIPTCSWHSRSWRAVHTRPFWSHHCHPQLLVLA